MKGPSILVVDDEESVRFTLSAFLDDENYRTSSAGSFEEAVGLLEAQKFDVAYLDIVLDHGKSGIELLKKIKNANPGAEVIIITGAPTVDTASDALRHGALDYLVKPVRQEMLLRTTQMALKHKALREAKETYRLNLEAIFRSVRDAIITVDDRMRLVEANPVAEELCGIDRSDASGREVSELLGSCGQACLEALDRTVRRGEPEDLPCVECDLESNPDQIVSITTSPLLRPDGTASGGVLVLRNKTRMVELERCLAECREMNRIIGASEGIRRVKEMIRTLADVQSSVLLTGESGTGKELVADALHAAGDRCGKNLVKINCAALSEGLLESELFGHVRGAFTGALRDKVGRFQRANGGTIFLDEIGEISKQTQLRFLRVLETMEFERVGDSTPVRVDVRVIAAPNCDLAKKVEAGEFREDLYFRLKVVEVKLPPLRERRGDIPLLVQYFLGAFNARHGKRIQGVSDRVMELFESSPWPGNVRQLGNVLEHACVLGRGEVVTTGDLAEDFIDATGADGPTARSDDPSAEERRIREALEQTGFNKTETARRLGMSRRTLYRRLADLEMNV